MPRSRLKRSRPKSKKIRSKPKCRSKCGSKRRYRANEEFKLLPASQNLRFAFIGNKCPYGKPKCYNIQKGLRYFEIVFNPSTKKLLIEWFGNNGLRQEEIQTFEQLGEKSTKFLINDALSFELKDDMWKRLRLEEIIKANNHADKKKELSVALRPRTPEFLVSPEN